MVIESFSIAPALLGGALIGLAVVALMAATGRIAGISGIVGGVFSGRAHDRAWRLAFVGGLIAGVLIAVKVFGVEIPAAQNTSKALLIASGLLVGIGTTLAAGCTSGHGVCGIARGSLRSIVATCVFMATGAATVFALRHLINYN